MRMSSSGSQIQRSKKGVRSMKSKISVSKNLNELKERANQKAATLSMNPKNIT